MPASGRDFDSRLPMTSVVQCTVSPSNSGWRKFHVRHAEIGDGGADRHVVDRDADHQAEREQRVHQRLAPFGLGLAEMPVDVQRLRVERHVGEQHVVHLRDRAAVAVLGERPTSKSSKYRPPRLCRLPFPASSEPPGAIASLSLRLP